MAAKSGNSCNNKDDRGFREKYRGKGPIYAQLPQQQQAHKGNNEILNNHIHDDIIGKVWIYEGSICDADLIQDMDAIVNPANERLWTHGSGVCGAIFKSCGGQQMEKACNGITSKCDDNRIPTGQTAVTSSFKLKQLSRILHTVAPC